MRESTIWPPRVTTSCEPPLRPEVSTPRFARRGSNPRATCALEESCLTCPAVPERCDPVLGRNWIFTHNLLPAPTNLFLHATGLGKMQDALQEQKEHNERSTIRLFLRCLRLDSYSHERVGRVVIRPSFRILPYLTSPAREMQVQACLPLAQQQLVCDWFNSIPTTRHRTVMTFTTSCSREWRRAVSA